MEGNAVCNDGKRSFYHRTEHDPQRSSIGALLRSGLSERKGQGKIWPCHRHCTTRSLAEDAWHP